MVLHYQLIQSEKPDGPGNTCTPVRTPDFS